MEMEIKSNHMKVAQQDIDIIFAQKKNQVYL